MERFGPSVEPASGILNFDLIRLPYFSDVKIFATNALGQKLFEDKVEQQRPGTYEFTLTPKNWASGIYFIHFKTDKDVKTHKVLYLK